jgi:hypothetical protein
MSSSDRLDVGPVAEPDPGATGSEQDDVLVGAPRRPAARAYRRLAAASRRPVVRRVAQVVIVAGVGVAVAVAVVRAPGARPKPATSPLLASACASGKCQPIGLTETELRDVRTALGGYTTTGLRLRDPTNVPQQIEIVSTDSIRVLTINAARSARPPSDWASELVSPATAGGADRFVIRSVVISPADQAPWVMEIRATGPAVSTRLLGVARALGADRSLVG